MLRHHIPYASATLLFTYLSSSDITIFFLLFLLAVLWLPIIDLLEKEAEEKKRFEEEYVWHMDSQVCDPITQSHKNS